MRNRVDLKAVGLIDRFDPANASDSAKLRLLAEWFDAYDTQHGTTGDREVQRDLLRIADRLEAVPIMPTKGARRK